MHVSGKRFGLGLVQIGLIIEGKDKEDTCESALCSVYPNMYLCMSEGQWYPARSCLALIV